MSDNHPHYSHDDHAVTRFAVNVHTEGEAVTRDPVCGMLVDLAAGKPALEHAGHRYHFCSDTCCDKFKATPDAHASAKDPVCGMEFARSLDGAAQSIRPL